MSIENELKRSTMRLLRSEIKLTTTLICDHISVCRALDVRVDARKLRMLRSKRIELERELLALYDAK